MDGEMTKRKKDMHQERTRVENKGGERWRRVPCYEPQLWFFKIKASQVLPVQQSYIHKHPEQRTLRHPHTQPICFKQHNTKCHMSYLVVLLSIYMNVAFQNKPSSNTKSFKTQ